MKPQKIINNWLYAFGREVEKQSIADHVLSHGNFLWHIFSYRYVRCLEGDEARAEFERISYDKAIQFKDGYAGVISDVKEIGKNTARDLDRLQGQDVYIVAEDFSWTYVKTHENGWCGPYFCYRQPEAWASREAEEE